MRTSSPVVRVVLTLVFCLAASAASATRYTYSTPMVFPTPDGYFGQGAVIETQDLIGVITRVRVTLHDVYIPNPANVEIYFTPLGDSFGTSLFTVHPALLSTANHSTITFDDFVPTRIPNTQVLTSGTYQRVDNAHYETLSNYLGHNPNRQWELFVYIRGEGSIGSWSLDIENAEPDGDPQTFSGGGLTINDTVFFSNPTTPFPSSVAVSGLDGKVVFGAEISLNDFTSPIPEDLDMLLQAPDTRGTVFYSDLGANCDPSLTSCGPSIGVEHLNMTFVAPDGQPGASPIAPLLSGRFQVFDIDLRLSGPGDPDDFFPPASRNYANMMQALYGAPANGTWSLFVLDDHPNANAPSSIGEWNVKIWPGRPEPLAMAPTPDITADAPPGQCSAPVTFDTPFVKGSPTPVLSISPASGTTFPVGVHVINLNAFNYVGSLDRTFNVTVRDVERPILPVPAAMVFSNDPNPLGTQINFALTVSDNCAGVTVTTNPPSGSFFQLGTTHVTAYAIDASGNTSDTVEFDVTIEDTTAPVITYEATPAISSGWVNHDVAISVSASDIGGTGVTQLACLGSKPSVIGVASVTAVISAEGENHIICHAFDASFNERIFELPVIKIDKTPPHMEVIHTSPANANGWWNTPVTVTVNPSDDISGIQSMDADRTLSLSGEGVANAFVVFAHDRAGNCAVVVIGQAGIGIPCDISRYPRLQVDMTPPSVTLNRAPAANTFGWNNTDVQVHAFATDALSGIDGAATQDDLFSSEGDHGGGLLAFTDRAGNVTTVTVPLVRIDKTAPSFVNVIQEPPPNAAGWNRDPVHLSATAVDDLSGLIEDPIFDQMVTTEGQFTLPVSVHDRAGNAASRTFVVKTDWTPPTANVVRPFGAPNANGWDSNAVLLNFTANDAGSGLQPLGLHFTLKQVNHGAEGFNQSVSGEVPVDLAGNVGVAATFTGLNIDRTPPIVTKLRSPAANAFGWNNTDVTVDFAATDALSGVDGPATVQQVFSAEKNNFASQTFTDRAGNTATGFEQNILIDKTPPQVSSSAFPGPNAAGWNNTAVTLRFDGFDNNPNGINSGVPAGVFNIVLENEGQNLGGDHTFTDRAGNSATVSRSGVNIDRTPPQVIVTKTPAANQFGWNNTDVLVQFAAADAFSGISGPNTAEELVTYERKGWLVTRSFYDAAGNRRDATASVSIDRTPAYLYCQANPAFITPGSGLVPVTLNVYFDDGDEYTEASRGPAFTRLVSIVSSAPQPGDIVDWTPGTDDLDGSLLAPVVTGSSIVYTIAYEASDLAGNLSNCTMQVTVANPATQIFSLSPNTAVKGSSADVQLVIQGVGFVNGATVRWNSTVLSSTLVSESEIHATVPAALLAAAGGVAVTVENPSPFAGVPGASAFLVTDSSVSVTSLRSGQSTPDNPYVGLSAGGTPEGAPDTLFVNAYGVGTLAIATFDGNPGGAFAGGTRFFDVFVAPGSAFTQIDIWSCDLGGATEMFWHSPAGWRLASNQTFYPGDGTNPSCINVFVNDTTSPSIADLMGTYFAAGADISPPTLNLPAPISTTATSALGAIVSYTATAHDDTDPNPILTCAPPSGSQFPIGQTTVACTATDATGHSASGTFTVTVTQAGESGHLWGGGFIEAGGNKHHIEIDVRRTRNSQGGEVEYKVTGPAKGRKSPPSHFESTRISSVTFTNGGKTVTVTGAGKWNDERGYAFELSATDAGRGDSVSIVIKNAAGAVVGSVAGTLSGGNYETESRRDERR